MTERLMSWLCVAAIFMTSVFVRAYKTELAPYLSQAVIGLAIGAAVYRFVVVESAKRTVLRRRRMYKELWARDAQDSSDLRETERDAVMFLGRIKGAKVVITLLFAGTIAALLEHADELALVLALGQFLLAGQLHFRTANIEKDIPADPQRTLGLADIPHSSSGKYLVDIDLQKVHDFIMPPAALPFWDHDEVRQWLTTCGFVPAPSGKWEAPASALFYLNADEVLSIQPVLTGVRPGARVF